MPLDSWLPIGFKTPTGEKTGRAIYEGHDWQIYEAQGGGHILVAADGLAKTWILSGLLEGGSLRPFQFGGKTFQELYSSTLHTLIPISQYKSPDNKNEALALAYALRTSREKDSECSLHDAIYIERLSRLIPTYTLSPPVPDDVVFGTWLTGGVPVSVQSFRRLRNLVGWMDATHLQDVLQKAGFEVQEKVLRGKKSDIAGPKSQAQQSEQQKGFVLTGRPELELFINEHVIDIIENESRYKALGIDFPSAIVLHGPPGCGKTFAIERMVDYLGWPSFQIEASSVASPYIHETSKKVAEMFDKAIQNAPSVLVIDEMEAFLADRQMGAGSSHHRVEEMAEFLRRIPEAIKNHVLIVAMTNRIEMIDSAILRRGRFDHVVKVDMASEEGIYALLKKLIAELPHTDDVDVIPLAKSFTGRPLSDVTFMVREAARLAARAGMDAIDQSSLLNALKNTAARSEDGSSSRKIGFM
jgi:cell division protease FtsH